MTHLRVLIATGLYPPDIGGPATYSKFLMEHLPAHGVAVELLPFREVRKYPPLVRHLLFFFKVLARGRSADVLYAQDTFSVGLPTALANLILRKRLFVRVPGDHAWEQGVRRFGVTGPLEKMPLFSWKWNFILMVMRTLQLFVVRSANALIVPSKYMGRIVRGWRVDPKKVIHIYNGIEDFKETGNKPVLRGLLRFQGKLVLSIGRLVPWKGFTALIELVPVLKREFPDLKLLIIGAGSDMERLEKTSTELGLADSVIFAGEVEREILIRYIRIADVFVLNSRYEGLSHQLLEVMAVGVPIVTTRVGGNPEVIEDGKNGYLVAPDDTELIAERVTALLKDAELRARLTGAAKRTVKRFSNERMIEETVHLLKKGL
ncbi:MAG: glycosyltransferase family 4 protein [Patescibacteria group bacterium]|mgnify:CR=1 FL=1